MPRYGFGFGGGQSGGPKPPPGYAFVTTNSGRYIITTNNGANRVVVETS